MDMDIYMIHACFYIEFAHIHAIAPSFEVFEFNEEEIST
jgi:hypothetical protein